MPEMNGTEATRHIRTQGHVEKRSVPIIALTASATPEEIEKALDSGMNRHLGKPFKPHQLALVMAESLGLIADESQDIPPKSATIAVQDEILDLSFLHDFTDGDENQMDYFLQKFKVQYPMEIEKLDQAMMNKDYNLLYQTAHSFKPQLEFVGLKKGTILAQQLEHGAQAEMAFDELLPLLNQLKSLLSNLRAD